MIPIFYFEQKVESNTDAVGQIPYDSRVSGRLEHLPVVASLAGVKGSEPLLLKIAEGAMKEAGWTTEVMTGELCFRVGTNIRNVADSTNNWLGKRRLEAMPKSAVQREVSRTVAMGVIHHSPGLIDIAELAPVTMQVQPVVQPA